ncbi:MAG: TetR/AcrR family transcriptional regulator [Acidimicrobiales bacterium]|nr:TetR/AcrR family transcriptional regulator [Acidimicrobiales bacterium]
MIDHDANASGGRGKDSRRRLLEAGADLLAESSRGDLSRVLTTGAVAERAGLHRQTFYLNWASQSEYLDDFIDYVTDPSVSSSSERLARLAERMPPLREDPASEVRERVGETFRLHAEDPVQVARMVLWAFHAQDEKVADRLRSLYRTNDANTAAGYKAIGDQWGIEPRPPFTYESIGLLFNALRDGLLLHLTIDSSAVPPSFVEDVQLALSWAVTRRVGDPDDAQSLDEKFRSERAVAPAAEEVDGADGGTGPSGDGGATRGRR